MLKKGAGILLPISSLPSKYGIGTFGNDAYKFVDFLQSAGQKYWQILPMGPVSYGDSPYQSFSSFAGNPYYIDLQMLVDDGLIDDSEVKSYDFGGDENYIDYEKLFNNRYILLKKVFDKYFLKFEQHVEKFKRINEWAVDYALFMALKYKNNQKPFLNWDEDLIQRKNFAVEKAKNELHHEIDFWIFLQHLFYEQYFKLKNYANKKGISIIGDMPIYVALDSADAWANPKLFMLDENKMPKLVAGVPPDDFSADGQLWGNPLYNWDYMKKTNFEWWIERIKWSFELYDAVRIDHFRGFDEFYAIPFGSENARNGMWLPAKGKELFDLIKSKLGELNIIAEDLGFITKSVEDLIAHTGYLKMKVLQFAFDNNEKNPYLPQNYEKNSVAYTGTHDNDTLSGWFNGLANRVKEMVISSLNISSPIYKKSNSVNYFKNESELCSCNINDTDDINIDDTDDINFINKFDEFDSFEDLNIKIIEKLYQSNSLICIVPMQDFLCVGSRGRLNVPSTIGSNWKWRLSQNLLTDELAEKIKNITTKCNR